MVWNCLLDGTQACYNLHAVGNGVVEEGARYCRHLVNTCVRPQAMGFYKHLTLTYDNRSCLIERALMSSVRKSTSIPALIFFLANTEGGDVMIDGQGHVRSPFMC